MRKIIEYTLVSVDGVFAGPRTSEFMTYRDDACIRDGLGQLSACEAMLMGQTTYELFAQLWPGRDHPWADRLNAMKKYVFSSTLDRVAWSNAELGQSSPERVADPHPFPRVIEPVAIGLGRSSSGRRTLIYERAA